MKIPQTIEMQVGALNASEHNPRQITEDDFAELVKSLLLLPKGLYYRPVVVDDRNIALAGNMRLRALKYIHELGFDDLAEILRASYRFRHFDEAKQSALLNYWREWQMHPTVPTLYASELDEDKTLPEYRKRFGDVLVFSKSEIAKTFDEGDNFGDRRAIIYARNACFELARQIGATHFIELDDDYTYFKFRFDAQLRWHGADVQDLDAVFDMLLDYFNSAPMLTLAIGQGGDYIGGEKATRFNDGIQPMRKAMNSFICSVDRPFQFIGRINEDVNTYVLLGSRGGVFLSILQIGLDQLETQSNSGGMTELYLDAGTYVKSFYTVMYCPSCVVVSAMGTAHRRLHHHIKWRYAVPKILHESVKKVTTNGITPKQ